MQLVVELAIAKIRACQYIHILNEVTSVPNNNFRIICVINFYKIYFCSYNCYFPASVEFINSCIFQDSVKFFVRILTLLNYFCISTYSVNPFAANV